MQLTLHLTRRCNLRCTYCYFPDFPAEDMRLSTAARALERALEAMAGRGDGALQVTFFGGEPLLRSELIRRIVALFKNRLLFEKKQPALSWLVTTNGLLLDQAFLEFARREGIFVSLSIDGSPSTHDAERCTPNGEATSREVLSALSRLRTQPDRFSTYSVVTPRNAAVLDRSLQFLFEHGSRVLVTALDLGGAWSRDSMEALKHAYQRLARWYVATTLAGRHVELPVFDAKIRGVIEGKTPGCRAGATQWSVAPDGTIYPCVAFVAKRLRPIGHVDQAMSPEGSALPRPPREEACGRCAIRARCAQGCACANLLATGDEVGLSPVLCENERVVTPIADQIARELFALRAPLFIKRFYNPGHRLEGVVRELTRESP